MHLERRTTRSVLREKRAISASLPEALAAAGLKALIIASVGGVLAAGFAFWAASTTSTDVSSGFQNANVAFEKSVHEADIVVGIDQNKVGLLKNVPGDKCEVQTWQNGTRDGKTTLQVDTSVLTQKCSTATPLMDAGSGAHSLEMVFDIAKPSFAFTNLGGRKITFDSQGTSTLVTAARQDGTKRADWEDSRPYKVTMSLEARNEDAVKAAEKSVSTGFTNIVNVTAAGSGSKYVPAVSERPAPSTVHITSIVRSSTTGTPYSGAREGIAVTFTGGVCEAGDTTSVISYAQMRPVIANVDTLVKGHRDGSATTVHLGKVPNGSSGQVSVQSSCITDGPVVSDDAGWTQAIPATTLTVKQNAAKEKHDLSWVAVSSLPTTFELRWKIGSGAEAALATTDKLAYQAVSKPGENLGLTTTYSITAVVDGNRSPEATAGISNPMDKPSATTVTTSGMGATWSAITCQPYSTPQYSERHYQQSGTSTTISWTPASAWSTSRTLTGVTTPAMGRTVVEVQTRCAATETASTSPTSTSVQQAFYVPEAVTQTLTRSTTTGTVYAGAREGLQISYTGGRCYNNGAGTITFTWTPTAPSGQSSVSASVTGAGSTTARTQQLATVRNGAGGSAVADVTCNAGMSSTVKTTTGYTQPLPKPTLTVTQGTSAEQHVLTWNQVSSLATTFQVAKTAASGTQHATPASTTALTQTLDYTAGTNYGNKTDYTVKASVDAVSGVSNSASLTTPWPAPPAATSIAYARTGAGGLYQAGNITWSYASCPAGTTIYAQALENRTGQTNGTIAAGVRATQAWGANLKTYAWAPSYSYQGYKYGVGVNTKCRSNVTGFESAVKLTQGSDFLTPMAQPAAPKFNFHNYRTGANGSTEGYVSTCYKLGGVNCPGFPLGNVVDGKGGGYGPSYSLHYTTYCPAGSSLNYTNVVRDEKQWNNVPDANKPFDYLDGYQMSSGAKDWYPKYKTPVYDCKTPFGTVSPRSVVGSNTTIHIHRIWGS